MVLKFIKSAFLKTRSFLGDKIRKLFSKSINEETLEELEHILYSSDIGTEVTLKIVKDIQKQFGGKSNVNADDIVNNIKATVKSNLNDFNPEIKLQDGLTVILIVGVNGNGKTTTTAKLANYYHKIGKKVTLAAADTFRAAAIEQLEMWANKIGVELIKGQLGSDAASVAFDSLSAAIARNSDVLIIDTAGRLQTKTHLMQELEKIQRVLKKQLDSAPHETLLVVDGTIGQNAIEQAKIFNEYTPLSGLVLTKIDGTAKGGVVVPIQNQLKLPIKFVGVGEKVEDLKTFDADHFVDELFN